MTQNNPPKPNGSNKNQLFINGARWECAQCLELREDAERYRQLSQYVEWPESVRAAFDCGPKALIDAAIDATRI